MLKKDVECSVVAQTQWVAEFIEAAGRDTMFSSINLVSSLLLSAAIVIGLTSCGSGDYAPCLVSPEISSISPNTITAGAPQFTLTVKGHAFVASSSVQWNEGNRQTTFVSSGELSAVIAQADIAEAGTAYVRVETPNRSSTSGCSGDSESLPFNINP